MFVIYLSENVSWSQCYFSSPFIRQQHLPFWPNFGPLHPTPFWSSFSPYTFPHTLAQFGKAIFDFDVNLCHSVLFSHRMFSSINITNSSPALMESAEKQQTY